MRDSRRRRVFATGRNHGFHPVGGQHLQCAFKCRLRQRMRVEADVQRAANTLTRAVVADRLADRQHMPLVKARLERRTPMARGAECHSLPRYGRVGHLRVVGCDEFGHIHQHRRRGRLAR